MTKTAFITGVSRGLGKGLAQTFLNKQYRVYGCSRSGQSLHQNMHHVCCDLSEPNDIETQLPELLNGVKHLDIVILNAGIIGEIKTLQQTSIAELENMMTVNVWSNKAILDFLLKTRISIKQILLISSGAAILGSKGMGGYALSKAALNMLGKLYSREFNDTHISAIAPGLIDTEMMDYLCNQADHKAYPAVARLRSAKGTSAMQSPTTAGEKIHAALDALRKFPSGEFIDLRQITAPEEYAELMNYKKSLD